MGKSEVAIRKQKQRCQAKMKSLMQAIYNPTKIEKMNSINDYYSGKLEPEEDEKNNIFSFFKNEQLDKEKGRMGKWGELLQEDYGIRRQPQQEKKIMVNFQKMVYSSKRFATVRFKYLYLQWYQQLWKPS